MTEGLMHVPFKATGQREVDKNFLTIEQYHNRLNSRTTEAVATVYVESVEAAAQAATDAAIAQQIAAINAAMAEATARAIAAGAGAVADGYNEAIAEAIAAINAAGNDASSLAIANMDASLKLATLDAAAKAAAAQAKAISDAGIYTDGKRQVFWQPASSPPASDGLTPLSTRADGDTWFATDIDNAPYRWVTGEGWVAQPFGNEAIGSLDCGKIVTGTLDARFINGGTINGVNFKQESGVGATKHGVSLHDGGVFLTGEDATSLEGRIMSQTQANNITAWVRMDMQGQAGVAVHNSVMEGETAEIWGVDGVVVRGNTVIGADRNGTAYFADPVINGRKLTVYGDSDIRGKQDVVGKATVGSLDTAGVVTAASVLAGSIHNVCSGVKTVTGVTANVIRTWGIGFPAGRFDATPSITVTPVSTDPSNIQCSIGNVSATGFTVYVKRPITADVTIHWSAILLP